MSGHKPRRLLFELQSNSVTKSEFGMVSVVVQPLVTIPQLGWSCTLTSQADSLGQESRDRPAASSSINATALKRKFG